MDHNHQGHGHHHHGANSEQGDSNGHKCHHGKEQNHRHNHDLESFLPKMIKMMKWEAKNEAIMDYGCGDGSTGFKYILPEVVKHDSKLYSIDVNEKRVEVAKEKHVHPSITYAVGNILEQQFPFANMKFDKIFSIFVFEFVPDLKVALVQLNNSLKPKGQVCFTMHKTYFFDAVRTIAESERWNPYLKDYHKFTSNLAYSGSGTDENKFKTLLEEAGFTVPYAECQEKENFFDDIERYLDGTVSLFPYIDNIPMELRGELREDLRGVITTLAGVPRNSKQLNFKYQCIAAIGEKV